MHDQSVLTPGRGVPLGAGAARFRLRDGPRLLRLGPRQFALVDPGDQTLFTMDAGQRYLLHLLERCGSVGEVARAFEARFRQPVTARAVLEFVEQLRGLDLVDDGHPRAAVPAPAPRAAGAGAGAVDPLSWRAQGGALNCLFDVMALAFGWVFHPVWIVPVLALALTACQCVARNWPAFVRDATLTWQDHPFVPLLALSLAQTFLVLNIPRALFVGVACRRFGGRVRRFGVRLLEGVVPTFYSDFGDSVMLMGDRGRWTVLTADLWFQVAAGSLAVLGWGMAPGTFGGIFCLFLVASCAGGVVFNLDIFYKFNGYLLLCTVFREVRLQERALNETRAWLTFRRSPEALTPGERFWYRAYGVAFYIHHALVNSFVTAAAALFLVGRFGAAGAFWYIVFVYWFYHEPIGRFAMATPMLRWAVRGGGPWWVRWPSRVALLGCVAWLGFMPYNYEIVGECRLAAPREQGVRSQVDNDEIAEVFVTEGDLVEAGAPVAALVGRDARADVATNEADLENARAKLDLLLKQPSPEDVKVAAQDVEVGKIDLDLREKLADRAGKLMRRQAIAYEENEQILAARDSARAKLAGLVEKLKSTRKGPHEDDIRAAEADVRREDEELRRAREKLALTTLRAPIRGRVVTPNMKQKVGQHTPIGALVAVIQDPSTLVAEVAAYESAAVDVREGMKVNLRLYGLDGRLVTGRVVKVARVAEQASKFGNSNVRTDGETYLERGVNIKNTSRSNYVKLYVDLDPVDVRLSPDMTGYARVVVGRDVLWRAASRPIVRFLRTDAWSWLP